MFSLRFSCLFCSFLMLTGITYSQTNNKKNPKLNKESQLETFEEVTDMDEYEVYSTFLNSYLGVRKYRDEEKREVGIKRVVVLKKIPANLNKEVSDEKELKEIKPWFPEFPMANENLTLDEGAILDYIRKGRTNSILSEKMFKLSGKITFITRAYIDSLFNSSLPGDNCENGWKSFYEKYPNAHGFVTFSRVGFNKNKTQAFLQVSTSSGCRGSDTCFYILEKNNGEWSVKDTRLCVHS